MRAGHEDLEWKHCLRGIGMSQAEHRRKGSRKGALRLFWSGGSGKCDSPGKLAAIFVAEMQAGKFTEPAKLFFF